MVSVIVNVNWRTYYMLWVKAVSTYLNISFDISGPMTYTSEDGQTTLYGVVHGQGTNEESCGKSSLLIRVSAPEILTWITMKIKEYKKL